MVKEKTLAVICFFFFTAVAAKAFIVVFKATRRVLILCASHRNEAQENADTVCS